MNRLTGWGTNKNLNKFKGLLYIQQLAYFLYVIKGMRQNNFFVAVKFLACVWMGLAGVAACGEDASGVDRSSGELATQRYAVVNQQCVDTQAPDPEQAVVDAQHCRDQAARRNANPDRPFQGYRVVDGQCRNGVTNTPHPMSFCDPDVEHVMRSDNCDGIKRTTWGQEIWCYMGSCNGLTVYDPRSGQSIQCVGGGYSWQ